MEVGLTLNWVSGPVVDTIPLLLLLSHGVKVLILLGGLSLVRGDKNAVFCVLQVGRAVLGRRKLVLKPARGHLLLGGWIAVHVGGTGGDLALSIIFLLALPSHLIPLPWAGGVCKLRTLRFT